jgi:hypothetical protein
MIFGDILCDLLHHDIRYQHISEPGFSETIIGQLHAKTRIRTFDEKTGLKDQIQSIKGRQFSKTWMI